MQPDHPVSDDSVRADDVGSDASTATRPSRLTDGLQQPSLDQDTRVSSPASAGRTAAAWARAAVDPATMLVVWLAGASFYFRAEWSSGFRRVMGDNHDTVQLTYLQEHWYQVLDGQASWQNPAIFHPLKGVLGWSDGLVLFQIFYAPLRLLGTDMFLAAQLTMVLFSLVGFVSFVCLARVALGVERWVALLGGLVFTFANNIWMHLYWIQFLTVWLVPGIVLLGVLAFRALPAHPVRAVILGAASGLFAALAFFTDFYTAWFSALAAGLVLIITLVFNPRGTVQGLRRNLRDSWWLVLSMGLGFVVGLVPVLLTYLPAQRTVHHLPYATIMRFAPRPRDLLNVGPGNVFWTSLVHRVVPTTDLEFSALTYAVTPLVMTLAIVGSALALWMSRKEEDPRRRITAQSAVVLAATAVVLSVLPVRYHGHSLWAVIWHVPGATVIRRTNRIGIVIGLVASLALVCAASAVYRARGRRPYRLLRRATVVVLLLLAVAEQVNTTPMAGLDRSAELAFLRSAKAPPSSCRSFFALDPVNLSKSPPPRRYAIAVTDQIHAMLISQKYRIPTLNGYTSYQPQGWGKLLYPSSPTYLGAVKSWATEHDVLAGLCQLDLRTMQWQTQPALAG